MENPKTKLEEVENLARLLADELTLRYGPILGGEELRAALGFSSQDAFRQSVNRGTLEIAVFKIPNRRGRFALTKDVAAWLAFQRSNLEFPTRQKAGEAAVAIFSVKGD